MLEWNEPKRMEGQCFWLVCSGCTQHARQLNGQLDECATACLCLAAALSMTQVPAKGISAVASPWEACSV